MIEYKLENRLECMHIYVVIDKESPAVLKDVIAGPGSSGGLRNLPFGEAWKEVAAASY